MADQPSLKTLLARYQTLLLTSTDGIHVIDAGGNVVEVNPAFCRMLGYTREELLKLNVSDWDKESSQEALVARIGELRRHPALFETRHLRKDGTYRDVEINGVGVRLDGHDFLYASARDITDRKRAEQAQQNNQRLESLGILAGGIAHDFNNLLAGLGSQVDLAMVLLRSGKAAEALGRLEKTSRVFDRGRALTKRLLTFSKGGAPVRAPQSLGRHLDSWADMALVGSNLSVILAVDPDLWVCPCDIHQIGQVVSNLLINARQASPSGGRITVRAYNVLAGGPMVAVEISDEGPGIPDALADRIFDPFFTTKAEGTGLGLSVSYSIVTQHGGRIELAADGRPGASFTLYLPALPGAAVGSEVPVTGLFRAGGEAAVVMDDEEMLRDSVGGLLEDLGFTVFRAKDGQEVLALHEKTKGTPGEVRLFLLDNLVPGKMGGLETARELEARGTTAKIILMSGLFPPDESHRRLAKPFTREELSLVLEETFRPKG